MLVTLSYITLGIGILSALIIAIDVAKNPQHMKIMAVVWPIQGLYLGPFAIWFYWVMGRQHPSHHHGHGNKPFYQSVFVSTSHCSSGCTLGDLIGAPTVFIGGLTIAGSTLFADYTIEFILAYLFGIFFQMFSIMPMNPEMSLFKGFIEAIKADTLSLVAFEIGMFGWMAIVHYILFTTNIPEPNNPTFWFMMQIAMILGTATSYPANWLLVKKGIKHGM